MNYSVMYEEYSRDAERILKVIRKYEARLNQSKAQNLEKLNAVIASYRYIYYDLLNTARLLEKRSRKENNAA